MNEKILVVEDDKSISELIKYNLEKANFKCITFFIGEDALKFLDKQAVDLILLDIMLPKMSGLEICKLIKQNPDLSKIPIIFLTAKGEEIDRVIGFELGVDDYITKPFSPRELILRIKAILRRIKPQDEQKDILKFETLIIDIPRHKVTIKNKEIILSPLEFKLLFTLLKRKGRVQSRDVLISDVWEINAEVDTRTIDTHIKRLREKLLNYGKYIITLRGIGYKFQEEPE